MKWMSNRGGRERAFQVLISLCLALAGGTAGGNPQGMTVISGAAQSAQRGSTLQITTTSQNAFLQWNSFNIAPGETTVFQEPSATSIAFNNINNASPSAIFGSLRANGIVVLQNSSGFYFGPNAFVQAGGLVLTTAAINPWSSGGGAGWCFDGPPTSAPIVNYGTLQTASGGSLFLIAKQIDNHGTIAAPGGTAALVAGQEVLLSLRPDGLSLSAPVQLPAGSVNNQGRVVADAGQVLLQAQTVNNSGLIQANSVRQNNGVIELYASQDIQLAGSSVIQANGGGDGISAGGDITIKSGGTFSDNAGSQITATGGANGGKGGGIEVSAPNLLSLNSSMDAGAQPGYAGGHLFLDPEYIILSSTGSSASSGTVSEGSAPASGTLTLNPNSLNSFSQILLQASQNITLATPWTLSASDSATSLTLEAGNNIIFDSGDSLTVQNNCSVNLLAGVNFSHFGNNPIPIAAGSVTATSSSTANSITLNGNAGVQTAGGGITLIAGGGITAGTGTIESTGGGSILLQAIDQNISLGGTPWILSDNNSGTAASVTLEAGDNITVASGGGIQAGKNWAINLDAGVNNFSPASPVSVTTTSSTSASSITLSGSAKVNSANGNISLLAGGGVKFVPSAIQTTDGGSISLRQSQSIALNTPWTLPDNNSDLSATLTLQSGNNITIANGDNLTAGLNWNVSLIAGANVNTGVVTATSMSGNSSITLSGSANVLAANGTITLEAGNGVSVGRGGIVTGIDNGAVMATPGGNINVQALGGNVNCGSSPNGYDFLATFNAAGAGYAVDPNLGGISTANGGNVTITAVAGNISAVVPSSSSSSYGSSGALEDPGSGAFGVDPGNVILSAPLGNVTGHYVVANGTGTITALNGGSSSTSLTLSLIKGEWTVNATDNIFLSEVHNPNGMYNASDNTSAPTAFVYNYDPLASVALNAGDSVTITGSGLSRVFGITEALIFPPILTINAGAGGITLKKNVNLFPSPEGTLDITTTGGGNLTSTTGGAIINISDSQSDQWVSPNSFTSLDTTGNAALHVNDPNPVLINIGGSVSDIVLDSPKPVEMHVAGNIIDSSATILNLRPSDTTVISAGGEIFDHSSYVILPLPVGETPDFNALNQLADPYLDAITHAPVAVNNGNIATIPNPDYNSTLSIFAGDKGSPGSTFTYNAASRTLLFQGIMSSQVETALLQMTVPFLSAATIEQIYAQSQTEATHQLGGYDVAGPGTFQVNAASIDLGNGGGMVSLGIAGYSALVPYTARGANLDINTSGNLSLLSSAIESAYGGQININCGGTIDVGNVLVPSSSNQHPLGIDSLWDGDISVIAEGDINVDGSRIAAYDGGNIFVESLTGNVNAGDGGKGAVVVSKPYVNKKGQVEELQEVIPGSGILATSYPQLVPGQTSEHIGDITVETPEGNIVANKGGIVQIALEPGTVNNATINLDAGSKNSAGAVEFVGNVDAGGSGVVGGQVNISATGNINGLVVASLGANVTALQNVSATVLSQGGATVSAGGTVSGTIVGVGTVTVSGASDVAAAFAGGGVSASGPQSGAAVAAAPTGSSSASAAATTQQVNQSTQVNSDMAANGTGDDNDLLKKKKKAQLMQYEGRVTVLLPE
ncbi:MAG: beta strand repeat-containing protein [Limisphaerales bacterium]